LLTLKNYCTFTTVDQNGNGSSAIIIQAQKVDKKKKGGAKPPSSMYRGVSKNGRQKWQILVMGNSNQFFSPSVDSEKFAARVYDRFVL